MNKTPEPIETVKVPRKQITKLAKSVERYEANMPISLEYVLTFLFPSVWNNMQRSLQDQYTKGYLDGKNDRD